MLEKTLTFLIGKPICTNLCCHLNNDWQTEHRLYQMLVIFGCSRSFRCCASAASDSFMIQISEGGRVCVHLLLEYGDVVDVIAALSWIDECHFQQARLCSWVYHRPCITTNNSYLTLPVRGHEMEPCGTRKNILPIQHEKMKMILQVFPSQRLPFVLNKQRWEWNDFDVVPKFFVGWSSSF